MRPKLKLAKSLPPEIRRFRQATAAITTLLAYIAAVNSQSKDTIIVAYKHTTIDKLHIPIPAAAPLSLTLTFFLAATLKNPKNKLAAITTTLTLAIAALNPITRTPAYAVAILLPAIIIIVAAREQGKPTWETLKEYIAALSLIIAAMNLAAAVYWTAYIALDNSLPPWWPARLELMFTASLQPIIAATYAALPAIPVLALAPTRKNAKPPRIPHKNLFLAATLTLAALQNILPHLPSTNPAGYPVGVDVKWYVEWMNQINEPQEVFRAANGSRPLYMLLLYGMQRATGLPPVEVAKHMPTLLLPLLVYSHYLLAWQLTGDKGLAALAAFFAATGPQATVGVYSSFQANMLALTILNTGTALILTRKTLLAYPAAYLTGLTAELTHPWTTIQALAATTIYVLIHRRSRDKRRLAALLLLIAGMLHADILKTWAAGHIGGTAPEAAAPILTRLAAASAANLHKLKYTLSLLVKMYYGGYMNYPLLLLLPLVYLLRRHVKPLAYTTAWLVTLTPIYFLDWAAISRLILNTPLHIPLTLITAQLLADGRKGKEIAFSVMIIALSYTLKCVANMPPRHYF